MPVRDDSDVKTSVPVPAYLPQRAGIPLVRGDPARLVGADSGRRGDGSPDMLSDLPEMENRAGRSGSEHV